MSLLIAATVGFCDWLAVCVVPENHWCGRGKEDYGGKDAQATEGVEPLAAKSGVVGREAFSGTSAERCRFAFLSRRAGRSSERAFAIGREAPGCFFLRGGPDNCCGKLHLSRR